MTSIRDLDYSLLSGAASRDAGCHQPRREVIGLFGVPNFVVDGELFRGARHLPGIRTMLAT